jgi:F-type H+-transporting ATPase subunit a
MQDMQIYHPPLEIFPALGITGPVVMMLLSALLTFLCLSHLARRSDPVPQGFTANLLDAMYGFVRETIVVGFGGESMRPWTGFASALFFFILFCNLLGLVPLAPIFSTPTALPAVVIALAAMVFILTLWLNIKHHGPIGFLRKFIPAGIPIAAAPLMFIIELVGFVVKPASLAIRLCANMNAGHMVIAVFVAASKGFWFAPTSHWLTTTLSKAGTILPLLATTLMTGFEIFICFIQAMIFTILAIIYISDAIAEHH